MILPNVDGQIKVPHSATFDTDEIARQFEIAATVNDTAEEDSIRMSSQRISADQAAELVLRSLVPTDYEKGSISTKQNNIVSSVLKLYCGAGYGANLSSAEGTVWGALNAITQHIDHNTGRSDNTRIREAYFGKTSKVKTNAYNLAMDLCS